MPALFLQCPQHSAGHPVGCQVNEWTWSWSSGSYGPVLEGRTQAISVSFGGPGDGHLIRHGGRGKDMKGSRRFRKNYLEGWRP